MGRKKLIAPPRLPELSGARLLGRICLHPPRSVPQPISAPRQQNTRTEVTAQPPSPYRVREECRGGRGPLGDRFSRLLRSHRGDRPWRRAEGDLPLWDERESLANRAAILTAKIASRFCSWHRELGGANSTLDERAVLDMFALRFPEPACSATRTALRRLEPTAVPVNLQRAATLQSRFPSRAPPLPSPPAGLLDMGLAFQGLEQLQATEGLCAAVREGPEETPRPECLVRAGLLPPRTLRWTGEGQTSPPRG